ncbi:MAG: phosphoenolpyruvate synthase [Francisellaceae bacterium]
MKYIRNFETIGIKDIDAVGGKNASLGEMIQHLSILGVNVPNGFATTAEAFDDFLSLNRLDQKIADLLANLDHGDIAALSSAGATIRRWIMETPLPHLLIDEITHAYTQLKADDLIEPEVAVRSSATAEDLPDASFAGQQETCLNIRGINNIISAIHKVFASLYTDRAISYRIHQGFDHRNVSLSVGIQRMIRSDLAQSGVMFSLDTESGFEDVVFITSSYGLGEMIVQGAVNPDEFHVHKPTLQRGFRPIIKRNLGSKQKKMIFSDSTDANNSTQIVDVSPSHQQNFSLTDDQILQLAQYALIIEQHYSRPMDIEWGIDGTDGKIYILQARPETVAANLKRKNHIERYRLNEKGQRLTHGRSIGKKIGTGRARVIHSPEQMHDIQPGDVLVTDMTDPDWEPVMKIASAIVTNRGGRTCHAAIIAREMGIPAVVGCGNATDVIDNNSELTVSCAEGDTGFVYRGHLNYTVDTIDIDNMPSLPIKIMMNVGNPERAFDFCHLPNAGVGLARLEFIINSSIGIHPNALLKKNTLPAQLQQQIDTAIVGFKNPREFYISKLAEGIATIGAAFYPKEVIVRLSDFKSNEYANLLGGEYFEPQEENPMLGFRGASRYISETFKDAFSMECDAIKRVRNVMGLRNVQLMIPFVRTIDEAKSVISMLAVNGLVRGENGLKVIMMCELPSNAILAQEFLEHFDGFSIGSNDLTQLTLGLDRDSAIVSASFDERNKAVKALIQMAIFACNDAGKYIGICGQGPSDYPDFAKWLIEQRIESLSLNPDTMIETWVQLSNNKKSRPFSVI